MSKRDREIIYNRIVCELVAAAAADPCQRMTLREFMNRACITAAGALVAHLEFDDATDAYYEEERERDAWLAEYNSK